MGIYKKPFISALLAFFSLIHFLPLKIFALDAPTLLSAVTVNAHTISLGWRNNDLAADSVIIFRKTELSIWEAIDTIHSCTAKYSDTRLIAATTYYYCLVSESAGVLSEKSNVLSAATLSTVLRMTTSDITGAWNKKEKSVAIGFVDSANAETGFRLCRRNMPKGWVCIDSVKSLNPGELGARLQFTDKVVRQNSWYRYKVEAYNDSTTIASDNVTLYTYDYPDRDTAVVINRMGSAPIKPAGWIEQVGDSLYIMESLPQGGTGFAVIDVSDGRNPVFKNYLDANSLDERLKGTVLWPRIKLGVTAGKIIYGGGRYIYFKDELLQLRDAATHDLIDSISFPPKTGLAYETASLLLEEKTSDTTLFLIKQEVKVFGKLFSLHYLTFRQNKIELSSPIHNWSRTTGKGVTVNLAGCYNTKSILTVINPASILATGQIRPQYNYALFDVVAGTDSVLFHGIQGGYCPISIAALPNSSIGFARHDSAGRRTIYAFDLSDSRSGASFNLGAHSNEIQNANSRFRQAILDTAKKRLFVFEDASFTVYGYSLDISSIRSRGNIAKHPGVSIKLRSDGSIEFTVMRGPKVPGKIIICNLKGQVLDTVFFQKHRTAIWRQTGRSSGHVPSGNYAVIVSFEGDPKPETVVIRN